MLLYVTVDNSSLLEQYAISLYWAVVSTTQVGYGDIVAHTIAEVCTIFVTISLCACIFFFNVKINLLCYNKLKFAYLVQFQMMHI